MGPSQLSTRLRRIADSIDNSKKPSKTLVAQAIEQAMIAAGSVVMACPTTFSSMNGGSHNFTETTREQVIQYLNSDPTHAAILHVGDRNVAVYRESESPNEFYYDVAGVKGGFPFGGEMTATEALDEILSVEGPPFQNHYNV